MRGGEGAQEAKKKTCAMKTCSSGKGGGRKGSKSVQATRMLDHECYLLIIKSRLGTMIDNVISPERRVYIRYKCTYKEIGVAEKKRSLIMEMTPTYTRTYIYTEV